jgi:glutathione S-transferase
MFRSHRQVTRRNPVLHQMQVSGNCYKIRLAARQLGAPLTLKNYGLHDGSTRKPEFLSKNPNGRVPLLEFEDGRTLPESGAILWFLSEDTFLLPTDRWGRAEVLQWMFFEQYSHEPFIAVARFWLAFSPKEELEKKRHLIPEWHAKGNAALGVMQTHLARHDSTSMSEFVFQFLAADASLAQAKKRQNATPMTSSNTRMPLTQEFSPTQ